MMVQFTDAYMRESASMAYHIMWNEPFYQFIVKQSLFFLIVDYWLARHL